MLDGQEPKQPSKHCPIHNSNEHINGDAHTTVVEITEPKRVVSMGEAEPTDGQQHMDILDGSLHNPKHIRAMEDGKSPLEFLVKSGWEEDARVHEYGAKKYGRLNWRQDKILASTYEAAILRHYKAYFEDGEDIDPDSGEHHLAHIRACCAVMRDAETYNTLIDDRGLVESLQSKSDGEKEQS